MRVEQASQPGVVLTSAAPAYAASGSFREHLGPRQAAAFLGQAWASVVGEPASAQTTALLTAHWAVETDAGRGMPGHNFAGIKANAAESGAPFLTVEGHGAARHALRARFRVYANAEAGARDYVHLLATRYPAAISAARVGDASGFAKALADGGYFTADPAAYASALSYRLAALAGGPSASAGLGPQPWAQWAVEGLLHAFRGPEGDP